MTSTEIINSGKSVESYYQDNLPILLTQFEDESTIEIDFFKANLTLSSINHSLNFLTKSQLQDTLELVTDINLILKYGESDKELEKFKTQSSYNTLLNRMESIVVSIIEKIEVEEESYEIERYEALTNDPLQRLKLDESAVANAEAQLEIHKQLLEEESEFGTNIDRLTEQLEHVIELGANTQENVNDIYGQFIRNTLAPFGNNFLDVPVEKINQKDNIQYPKEGIPFIVENTQIEIWSDHFLESYAEKHLEESVDFLIDMCNATSTYNIIHEDWIGPQGVGKGTLAKSLLLAANELINTGSIVAKHLP